MSSMVCLTCIRSFPLFLVLGFVFSPLSSQAGGLYITEFGTPSSGVSHAGAAAVANDASTALHNPAGMTGFAYDSSPVKDKHRTADLPVDRQLRYSIGTQYQWSERLKLGGSFTYIDLGDAKIKNATLNGEFRRNEVYFIALNANWIF